MLNLTNHPITLIDVNGDAVTFQPSGTVAHVHVITKVVEHIGLVPVVTRILGKVEGLPEEGTPCLVSTMTAAAVPGRKGVYAPDVGISAMRDNGRVVAVTRLVAA